MYRLNSAMMSQMNKEVDQEKSDQVTKLQDYLAKKENLYERVYQMIQNFEWLFTTLTLISPPVEDVTLL